MQPLKHVHLMCIVNEIVGENMRDFSKQIDREIIIFVGKKEACANVRCVRACCKIGL